MREPEVKYTVEEVMSFFDQFDEPPIDTSYYFPEYVLDTYGDF